MYIYTTIRTEQELCKYTDDSILSPSKVRVWFTIRSMLYSGGHHDLYRCKTLNIYLKCCSKSKSRDSSKNCSSWGFQNTPNMFKLIKFWLRYLRSKTNDIIKISSKLIERDENLMKSIHFVSKVINSTSKTPQWTFKNDSYWHWSPQKLPE